MSRVGNVILPLDVFSLLSFSIKHLLRRVVSRQLKCAHPLLSALIFEVSSIVPVFVGSNSEDVLTSI